MIERTGFTDSLVLDVFTSQAHDLLPCVFLPMVIDAQTASPMNQMSVDPPGKSGFEQLRFPGVPKLLEAPFLRTLDWSFPTNYLPESLLAKHQLQMYPRYPANEAR
jgi:hypothetical protein